MTAYKIDYVDSLNTSPIKKKSDVDSVLVSRLLNDPPHTLFELIHNTRYIKPYFDVELKCTNITDKNIVLDKCLDVIKKHLGADCVCAVSDSSLDGVKISFHIVVTNRKTTMKTMNLLKNLLPSPFDKQPYISKYETDRYQKFRMVLTSKEGENRPLIPITFKDDISKHFIGNPDLDNEEFKMDDVVKTTAETQTILKTEGIGSKLIQTDDRSEWFIIGISLYTLYGEYQGKEEFKTYSLNWKDFNSINFEKTWKDIIDYKYTNGGWSVLKKYLPQELWSEYMPILPPYELSDRKTATWFFNNFNRYKVRYCEGDVYIFQNHRWSRYSEEELARDVMDFIGEAYDNLVQTCKEDEKEKAKKLCHKAGMYSFNNGLVKVIKLKASDSRFKEKLNQNRYLLGFDNGVLDLRTKEFRAGLPNDFITMTTGNDYSEDVDPIKMEFLQKVLLDMMCGDVKKYENLLDFLGRSLIGDNSITNQRFYCLYGGGKNGKSKLDDLISYTFGEYVKHPPTSLMTQNEGRSDSHNADIVNLVGSRFCIMSETKDGYINPQTLKKHTGEDKIEYRPVYGRVKYTTNISWTPILVSNDKIKVNSDDYGVMRRFTYIPFKARFQRNPEDYSKLNDGYTYYKAIENLDEVLQEHRVEFLQLLLKHCTHKKILTFCKEIMEDTEELIRSQDMLLDMIQTTFTKCDEKDLKYPTAISWSGVQQILNDNTKNANSLVFRRMKEKGLNDSDLLDKVTKRMEQAFNVTLTGKAQGSQVKYTDYEGNHRTARRLFIGITLNKDKEIEEDCLL